MSLIDGEYVPLTEKYEEEKAPLRFSAQQFNVNIYIAILSYLFRVLLQMFH
jgi:hypothetical protein